MADMVQEIEPRVTVAELAKRGRISQETVRRAIRAGELAAEGKGPKVIRVSEGERWLRSRCFAPTPRDEASA